MTTTNTIFALPTPPAGDAVNIAFVESLSAAGATSATTGTTGVVIVGVLELSPASASSTTTSASGVVLVTLPRQTDSVFALPTPPSGDAVDMAFVELLAPAATSSITFSANLGAISWGQGIGWGQGIEWSGPAGIKDVLISEVAWNIQNQLEREVAWWIKNQKETETAWNIHGIFRINWSGK